MLYICKVTKYFWGRGKLHTLLAFRRKSQSGQGMVIVLQKKITYSSVNRLHSLTIRTSCFFQVFLGTSCRCIKDTSIFEDLICQLENNFISLYGPKYISVSRDSGVYTINSTIETLSKLMKLLKIYNTLSCYNRLYFPQTTVEKLFLN